MIKTSVKELVSAFQHSTEEQGMNGWNLSLFSLSEFIKLIAPFLKQVQGPLGISEHTSWVYKSFVRTEGETFYCPSGVMLN